jgi:tetratricopeptide (TPR) repeat protein
MEPDNPVYYSNYSVFLMGSGRIPEAKHYLNKSLQIDQANPLTLYNYSCLEYEEGNIDGAVSVLRKCVALDEERNPLYLVSAAVCLFKQGVYGEAAKYYNKAQNITQTNNPQNFTITHRHWNSIKLALETFG